MRSARIGTGSPGTISSVGISRGSTSSSWQSIIPNATRACSAARRSTASGRSSTLVASSATTIWRSSRLRRPRSRARRLWLSASRLNSSSPGSSSRPGSSPADTWSTDRAIARSGAPRSAASSAARSTANTTETAMARISTRAGAVSAPVVPVTSRNTMPNPATRQDGGGDQAERQPRPEPEARGPVDRQRHGLVRARGLGRVGGRAALQPGLLGGPLGRVDARDPLGELAALDAARRRRRSGRTLVGHDVGLAHRGDWLAPTSR